MKEGLEGEERGSEKEVEVIVLYTEKKK